MPYVKGAHVGCYSSRSQHCSSPIRLQLVPISQECLTRAKCLPGLAHASSQSSSQRVLLAMMYCWYDQIAFVLKWLTLALFAYVITAFIAGPAWGCVLYDTFIPSLPQGHDGWRNLVAVLGTTISPYLFFWQASQEIEEQKAKGRRTLGSRKGATKREIRDRQIDVGVGTFFSNLVMYFIILTTALTLHAHNQTDINNSRQVAEALKPLAGSFAAGLYAIGLVGVGLLVIPILAGSSAYAITETFALEEGLDRRVTSARYFYGVIGASTLLGVAVVFAKISPIKALFWASIVNGVLSPFLLIGILIISCDRKLMQRQPSPWLSRVAVGLTAAIMLAAAGAMFIL